MTDLVFKKPPETLLVSLTSWKCHGAKLVKKALLPVIAGYPWYTRIPGNSPLLGFGSSSALHKALQGATPPHTGLRLMAGFGW